MPSAKRANKSVSKASSNSTLLDFFTPKQSSNPTASISSLKTKTKKRSSSSVREVIVIDSDSEDEQPYKPARDKRRRLSTDSFYKDNDAASKLPRSSSPKKEISFRTSSSTAHNSSETRAPCPSFGQPTLLLQLSSSPSDVPPVLSFGKPSGLMPSPISKEFSQSSILENDPSVGSSSSNLLQVDIDVAANNIESVASGLETKIELATDTHVDIDLSSDIWETGDDETEAILYNRNSVIEDDSKADILQECPICEVKLVGLSTVEFQAHVNKCLDSQTVPTLNIERTIRSTKSVVTATNAFTKLTEAMAENEAWNEVNTERKGGSTGKGARRKAPFYKVLQGMPIAVDAFCYGKIPGVTAYFLTHAHSDHYTNLSSSWKYGPIYCSEGTANLITHMLTVDPKWVHPLPLDTPTIIPNTGNVSVTLIEANHCPGSSLFLFEGPQTVHAGDSNFKSSFIGSSKIFRYLHCGDFRASPRHVLHPCVKGKKIDHVYLDTTYLDPKYTFPPQAQVISACAELAKRIVTKQPLVDSKSSVGAWLKPKEAEVQKPPATPEKVLVVVGTYSIGKERIVKVIAQALNSKVYCDNKKAALLRCQSDSELDTLLTSDPLAATVHIVPLGIINVDGLSSYLKRYKSVFTKAIGFRPTGWCFTPSAGSATQTLSIPCILDRTRQQGFSHHDLHPSRNSSGSIQLIPVPYSEHSSFGELTCFAMSINWSKMIPTVNVGSAASRKKMSVWIEKWEVERKKRGETPVVPHRHPEYW